MKYFRLSLMLVLAVAFLSACGSSKRNVKGELSDLPKWYLQPPTDNKDFLYAIASASSVNLEMARKAAMANASAEMARKLSSKVESLQKSFNEEVTSGSESNYDATFSEVTKVIANQTLAGLAMDKQEFKPSPGNNRIQAYVLVKYPVGDARKTIENALSRDQEFYVKFKSSQAFKELQEDISRVGN